MHRKSIFKGLLICIGLLSFGANAENGDLESFSDADEQGTEQPQGDAASGGEFPQGGPQQGFAGPTGGPQAFGPPPEEFGDLRELCSQARDNVPLPGHILRLGFVSRMQGNFGFFFPDQFSRGLQGIAISRNVGVIGQDPFTDYSQAIWMTTPEQQFVVAQAFVADPAREPIVTCVSLPRPISTYVPTYFGFTWLPRADFFMFRGYRKFHRWNWRRNYSDRFDSIRSRFRSNRFANRFSNVLRRSSDRKYYGRKSNWLQEQSQLRSDRFKGIGNRLRDRANQGKRIGQKIDFGKMRDRLSDKTKVDFGKIRDRFKDRGANLGKLPQLGAGKTTKINDGQTKVNQGIRDRLSSMKTQLGMRRGKPQGFQNLPSFQKQSGQKFGGMLSQSGQNQGFRKSSNQGGIPQFGGGQSSGGKMKGFTSRVKQGGGVITDDQNNPQRRKRR